MRNLQERQPILLTSALVLALILVAAATPASGSTTYGRWRGINPTQYSADVTPAILRSIYVRVGGTGAIGAGDAWAVGGDGSPATPIIEHYDGFSWQILGSPVTPALWTSAHFCTAPGAPSVGLCGPNPDGSDGWIVGGTRQDLTGTATAAYWDGSALTPITIGLAGATILNSVFLVCHSPAYATGCPSGGAFSGGLTIAVGSNGAKGVIYQFNGNPKSGGGWSLQFTSANTLQFNSVYMYVDQSGALAGFAVGDGGWVARLNGGAWTESQITGANDLLGVFVDNGNPVDAWAIGKVGQIWRFNQFGWTGPVSPGSTLSHLYGIFLTSTTEGWIVGNSAVILHSTTLGSANVWTALTTPIQTGADAALDLRGVSFTNSGNGWAVGSSGVILQTSNTACGSAVAGPCWGGSTSITQTVQLNSVYEISPSDAWAGGLFDTTGVATSLIHWDGGKWHRATVSPLLVTQPDIWGIFMLSSTEGWAVGSDAGNTVPQALRWDGNSWTGQPIAPCTCSVRSVYMISGGTSGDGWAVGTGGKIFRYQSGSWLLQSSPTAQNLNSVFISNSGNNLNAGWAVGNAGTVLKLQITGGVPTWTLVGPLLGVTTNLYSVFFKDANHGWIVGGDNSGTNPAVILTTSDGGNSWSGGAGQVTGASSFVVLRSVFIDTMGTGAGNGDGWAVGEDDAIGPPFNGFFAHWDGASWVATTISPPLAAGIPNFGLALHSVSLTSPTDGFAVGERVNGGGALAGIFHLDPPNPPTQVVTTTSTSTVSSTTVATTPTSAATSVTSSSPTTPTTSTQVSTQIVTSVSTQVVTATSTGPTTPLQSPGIPGFPWESILIGLAVGLVTLAVVRRRKLTAK